MSKLKILMATEASFLNSGFGNYTRELLTRLHATNKYEIAEFANYGYIGDERDNKIPWKYYPNAVRENDPRHNEYKANPLNQFGAWRFDNVILDFKPDIVFNILDCWMVEHQYHSPLRQYYHWVSMPTVDSAPYKHEWIEMYMDCDAIFTYSQWGMNELIKQSNGRMRCQKPAWAGVDHNIFKPVSNKQLHKQQMGIDPDWNIVGTVMRNQKRKLYPDLFEAFRIFLDNASKELADKTYLYCHLSFPDVGWDIPHLLKKYQLCNKALFTYVCTKTQQIYSSLFQDAKTYSPYSNGYDGIMANVRLGATTEQMARIYNSFDLYIQYAICFAEGQEVLTKEHGWIPIEKVEVGMNCFTHKSRWRPVTHVWKNLPKSKGKKVLEMSLWGDYETLRVTENHPIHAYTHNELPKRKKDKNVRELLGDKVRQNQTIPEPTKYELSQLKPKDLVLYPIDDEVKDVEKIDLAPYTKEKDLILDSFIEVTHSHTYPRFMYINKEFCRFLGLYVADGYSQVSKSSNTTRITTNLDERANSDLSYSAFQKIGKGNVSTRVYKGRHAKDIYISSRIHAKYFRETCGKFTNKRFPDWVLHLPLEKQKECLIGLFMGDGHYKKQQIVSTLSTISPKLATQLKFVLRRLRINFNVKIVDKNKYNHYDNYNRQPQYTFEIKGNISEGEFNTTRKNSRGVYINNYHLMQIKEIKQINYQGNLHNLTIQEDHTLALKAVAAAQCE